MIIVTAILGAETIIRYLPFIKAENTLFSSLSQNYFYLGWG